ncbi:MAG: hypothetical protein M1457_01775 [bacterium]|nr:hypothetical protein [bacterium]
MLIELLRHFPGNTEIRLSGYGERKGWTWRRLVRLKVFFCSPLFQGLCKVLPADAIKLYGTAGEPLLVKATPAAEEGEDPPGDDGRLPHTGPEHGGPSRETAGSQALE